MTRTASIFLLFLAACCTRSFAQTAPTAEFSAAGDSASLPLTLESDGTWGVSSGTQVALGNGVTFTLNSIVVNADPYVYYSYNVTNTSSSTMEYTASIPATTVSLAPGQYAVSSSLGISLTDAMPSSGVTIQPVSSPGAIQQAFVGANDAGVDLGTATITNGSFGSTSTTNYTGAAIYNLAAPATTISLSTSFDLSAGASVGLSGFFNVQAVPEPSSVGFGLVAAGAFVFLMMRARRSRA
jgi:hypothetical protein